MENALRKALWGFLRPLIQLITNLLSPEVGEEWTAEFKKFLRREQCWVKEKVSKTEQLARQILLLFRARGCVSRYPHERILVGATDGTETLASSEFFSGGVSGEALPGEFNTHATEETEAIVFDVVENVSYRKLFKNGPYWTESQVVKFCCDHRSRLAGGSYATFFPFRREPTDRKLPNLFPIPEHFVARVFWDKGRCVAIDYPTRDIILRKGDNRRVVIPVK